MKWYFRRGWGIDLPLERVYLRKPYDTDDGGFKTISEITWFPEIKQTLETGIEEWLGDMQ